MRRGIGVTAAAVLCAALLATPAGAAFERAPVELGDSDGDSPSVVMDPAGTAHIVWGVAEELMSYCALPRGARSCARTASLALDARDGRPTILRRTSDGGLIVVVGRDDLGDDPDESMWAFTSTDGATWSPPALIGVGLKGPDDAVLAPDGLAVDLLQADTGSNLFQRAPLGGPPPAAVLNLASSPTGAATEYDYPGQLLALRSGRTMALLGSPADGFAYRLLTGADPFADAAWTPWPAKRVTAEDDEPRAATGPRGTYVMYGVHPLDQVRGAAPQVVRRFRGTRWARPRGLFYEVDANTDRSALAQDGKGRLHAVVVGNADGGDRACIAYARTSKRRWFSRAGSVHQTLVDAEEPGGLRLAVDRRGRGVVTWATGGTPSKARVQWLKARRGVTRPTNYLRRSCPPFPR